MKTIRIKKIESADKSSILVRQKYHRISLGNGLTCYFTSVRNASAFMAQTNRFLNQKVLELNKIYIDIWAEQRSLHLVFYHIFSKDQYMKEFVVNIERSLDMVMTRSGYQNGNHFTFKWFYNVIDALEAWNFHLIELLKAKNRFYNIYNLEIISQRLTWLKAMFDAWGKEHAEKEPAFYGDFREIEDGVRRHGR